MNDWKRWNRLEKPVLIFIGFGVFFGLAWLAIRPQMSVSLNPSIKQAISDSSHSFYWSWAVQALLYPIPESALKHAVLDFWTQTDEI